MQGQTVGKLSIDENENYHFKYHQDWVDKGFTISPHLPFNKECSSIAIILLPSCTPLVMIRLGL